MTKNAYFQKTIHDRLVTVGFSVKKGGNFEKLLLTAIAIQHPVLDKADPGKGKIIVKNRMERRKITDNKWTVVCELYPDSRIFFTYPVLKAMAEVKFNHFETFPNDYIAGFDK